MFQLEIRHQKEFFKILEDKGVGKAEVWYGEDHKWGGDSGTRTQYDSGYRLIQAYIIFPTECVFDVDDESKERNREYISAIKQVLEKDEIPFVLLDTGGRGYHIHIFLKSASIRHQLFHLILAKARHTCLDLKVDEGLMRESVHLIRAPFSLHPKTNKQCVFLDQNFNPMTEIPEIRIYKPVLKEFRSPSKNEESFGETPTMAFQQVRGGKFVTWDGRKFEKVDSVTVGNRVIKPLQGEEVDKGFVFLADDAEEYSTSQSLVTEIIEFSKKYVDIPEDFRVFASYYVLLSWIYDKGNTVPYLRFMGDTGCGKTRAMDVFLSICYNSIPAAGAANAAPIFRIIEKWRGAIGFEEADFRASDEKNELIKVINCGWERGKPIIRCEKNKPDRINFFDPYSPKVFATRKPFEDAATEGRCLTCVMEETRRGNIPAILPALFYEEARGLRNKLLAFRLKSYKTINPDNALPLPVNLEPRLRQLATPFSTVFAGNEDAWGSFVIFLLEYQKQIKEARMSSLAGAVLSQLLQQATEEKEVIICKEISDALKTSIPVISKELRALGFTTEGRHVELSGRRKTVRAIVISENRWVVLCTRYLPETIPLPQQLKLCGAAGTGGTENTDLTKLTEYCESSISEPLNSVPCVPSAPEPNPAAPSDTNKITSKKATFSNGGGVC